ncbi:glutathione S-transferase zeta class isoform X4 [Cryptomeria japonica]|uniref:glutathione S-transferase zeta class isoform X4 n=1 Tax=Cryptomeria japonica TaxID=3369 RepID=UPI0027DA0CC8|nr:glutathione S-transferase zeta class isoform X4 [Cryptomeria japonica]
MASPLEENLNPIPSFVNLKLYSFWRSSCAWRVRIALNLKELPYEYKAVNLSEGEQFIEDYTELNPIQFVPTLVDGNTTVADSLAILLYLEDKYPAHPLLPDDLQLKAICMQRRMRDKLGPEEQIAWTKYFIERGFFALETLLKNVSGKYCIGDQVTLADVFLAPQVSSAAARFDVDVSKFPTLNKINQALVELPEFQAAVPEKTPDYIS